MQYIRDVQKLKNKCAAARSQNKTLLVSLLELRFLHKIFLSKSKLLLFKERQFNQKPQPSKVRTIFRNVQKPKLNEWALTQAQRQVVETTTS